MQRSGWCGVSSLPQLRLALSCEYLALTGWRVAGTQVWPMETEQDRGIAALWSTSEGLLSAPTHINTSSFFLFIANDLNTTAGMDVVHNAIYARQYARHAAAAGLNFACFFTDYHGMTADDVGDSRYTVVSSRYHRVTSYNLLSDFPATGSDWTETKQALSFVEQLRGAYQPRTSQNQLVRPRFIAGIWVASCQECR